MARKRDVSISRSKSAKSETSMAFVSSMGRFEERHQPVYIDVFGSIGCALDEDCTIDRELFDVDDFVGSFCRARERA